MPSWQVGLVNFSSPLGMVVATAVTAMLISTNSHTHENFLMSGFRQSWNDAVVAILTSLGVFLTAALVNNRHGIRRRGMG